MIESNKEQKKLSLILVFMIFIVFFIAVVGISFALPDYSIMHNNNYNGMMFINNKDVNEYSDGIVINGLYPIDDKISSIYSKSITFDIFSGNNNYDCKIILSSIYNNSNIDDSNVKISLVKDNKYIIGSKVSGELLSSIKYNEYLGGYVLDDYFLNSGEKHHYSLNVWLDDDYKGNVVMSSSDDKDKFTIVSDSFSININASFVQK